MRGTHSVVLERRGVDGRWETVKQLGGFFNPNGDPIVLDNLTRDKIAFLNEACASNFRWVSND